MTGTSGRRTPGIASHHPPVVIVALPGVPTWPFEPFWQALGYTLRTATERANIGDMADNLAHAGSATVLAGPARPLGNALPDALAAHGASIVVIERDPRDAACQHAASWDSVGEPVGGQPVDQSGHTRHLEDLAPATLSDLVSGGGDRDSFIARLGHDDPWREHPDALWVPYEMAVGARLGGADDTRLQARLRIAAAVGWRGSAFQLARALSAGSGYDVRMGRWDDVGAWQHSLPPGMRADLERGLADAALDYETRVRHWSARFAISGALTGLLSALANEHAATVEAAEARIASVVAESDARQDAVRHLEARLDEAQRESEARQASLGVLKQRLAEAAAKASAIEARLVAAQQESEARRASLQVLQERLAATQQENAARQASLRVLEQRLAEAPRQRAAGITPPP